MDDSAERYNMVNLCLAPAPERPKKYRLARESWKSFIEHFMRHMLTLEEGHALDTRYELVGFDPVTVSLYRGGMTACLACVRRIDGTPAAASLYLPSLDIRDDATAIAMLRSLHPSISEAVFAAVRRSRCTYGPNAINIAFDRDAFDCPVIQSTMMSIGIAHARLLGTLEQASAEE